MQKVRESKHRLDRECYIGLVRANFALCIKDRKWVFVERKIVDCFVEILGEAREKHSCLNWAYTFMPDHVHVILEGKCETSDLWKTMVLFKQRTGYWFSRYKKYIEWQKDFYDHIHRGDVDLRSHIEYILDNPVRKGLVKNWQDYPYKGSLDSDLEEIMYGMQF